MLKRKKERMETINYLQSTVEAQAKQITVLEERDSSRTQEIYRMRATHDSMVTAMQTWTLEALESRDISETNAEEIAEICGFDLNHEYDVTVTVEYNFTVTGRNKEDVENEVLSIDFDAINYNDDVISYCSAEVSDTSIHKSW